ncbi:MAG TPA: transcription antitermination factor NusB, partial [Mycobacteriales bacterium]|nr:transcription antitermination factor NusB [Mycobacteriales bacterium]
MSPHPRRGDAASSAPSRAPGRGRPDSRRTRSDPDPRRVAYDVLRAVSQRQAYANLLLPGLLRQRRITGRDAGLATELTYGTLRAQGTIDLVLAACAQRSLEAVDPPVRDVLRLGAYQILRTRIPTHAAVSTSVDLAREAVGPGPSRFVNAVLRRVADRDEEAWVRQLAPSPDTDPIGHLAVRHSHPEWIVAAFRDALGGDLDQTAQALAADE